MDSHSLPFEHQIVTRAGVQQWAIVGGTDGTIYLNRYSTSTGAFVESVLSISTAGVLTLTSSNLNLGQATAMVALTNSTTVTPDDTIGPATAIVAAAGEATAADLTTTQAVRAELLDSISDLTGKIGEIRAILVTAGLVAAP